MLEIHKIQIEPGTGEVKLTTSSGLLLDTTWVLSKKNPNEVSAPNKSNDDPEAGTNEWFIFSRKDKSMTTISSMAEDVKELFEEYVVRDIIFYNNFSESKEYAELTYDKYEKKYIKVHENKWIEALAPNTKKKVINFIATKKTDDVKLLTELVFRFVES